MSKLTRGAMPWTGMRSLRRTLILVTSRNGAQRGRGIVVSGTENSEDLVNLLSAVERFEAAVKSHGGDLMVDDLNSPQPDDPHFVVPRRAEGESVREYIGRIDDATVNLRHHPRRPD